jgi:hypothetical protein
MPKPTVRSLFAALALWLPPLGADPIPTEIRLPQESALGLFELAAQVSAGDETQQRDFAWVALAELLAAYEDEAATSRQAKPRDRKAWLKLSRWRSAAWAFSEELRQRLDALPQGAQVRIIAQGPNPVLISIDGQPTVISGPRAWDDQRLEQRIVLGYCSLQTCDLGPEPEPALPGSTPDPAPTGHWEYRQDRRPRYSTGDGLVFEFDQLDGAQAAGAAAEQLAGELRELATQLRGVRDLGTAVDWDNLQLRPRGDEDRHWVLLNRNGDYLRASLPRLYRNPELLRDAGPWLSARAEGEQTFLQIRQAERFTQDMRSGTDPAH